MSPILNPERARVNNWTGPPPNVPLARNNIVEFLSQYKVLECACCDNLVGFKDRTTGGTFCPHHLGIREAVKDGDGDGNGEEQNQMVPEDANSVEPKGREREAGSGRKEEDEIDFKENAHVNMEPKGSSKTLQSQLGSERSASAALREQQNSVKRMFRQEDLREQEDSVKRAVRQEAVRELEDSVLRAVRREALCQKEEPGSSKEVAQEKAASGSPKTSLGSGRSAKLIFGSGNPLRKVQFAQADMDLMQISMEEALPMKEKITKMARTEVEHVVKKRFIWTDMTYSENLVQGDFGGLATWVYNMAQMQVQATEDDDATQKLQSKINEYVASGGAKKCDRAPHKNEVLLAEYAGSGDYYRARVLDVKDSRVRVVFIDYGDIGMMEWETMYEMSAELAKIPIYSVWIALEGVEIPEGVKVSVPGDFDDYVTEPRLHVILSIDRGELVPQDEANIVGAILESKEGNINEWAKEVVKEAILAKK